LDLVEAFGTFLATSPQPIDDEDLFLWWPTFEDKIRIEAARLNRIARV
jgi:hypothetical protein